MKNPALICTKCKKSFPIDSLHPRCDICNEPLEVETVTTGRINKREALNQTILERYADFLPPTKVEDKVVSLYEGFTLAGSRRQGHL